MHKIELIEGAGNTAGGYSVNGKRYVGDEHEALVDEANQIAYATARTVEDVLLQIVPKAHLESTESASQDSDESTHWTNHYLCPCGEKWEDRWDSCCNDKCPSCNKEIEPYISDDGSVPQEAIDTAYAKALNGAGLFECSQCAAVHDIKDSIQIDGDLTCSQCQ